jgi:hypothetical protein
VDSKSGDELFSTTLGDMLRNLSQVDSSLIVYVPSGREVTPSTPVALLTVDDDPPQEVLSYLLEIEIIVDVLDDWKEWNEREPTLAEACAAIVYYAIHDAYQPMDED